MPVKVVFFNVGQGDCTLMTFFRPGAAKAHAAVLLDCGSTKAVAPRPAAGALPTGTAKDRMVAHLKQKIDDYLQNLETPGVLDYVLISHPDQDHFNLLKDVLIDPITRKLRYTLNNVWYALMPLDYKEGQKKDPFMETLLTNWASLTSAGGHRVVNAPQVKPSQPDPEPLFPEDPAAPNLYLLDGGAFLLSGPNAANYQSAPKETIANLSSLVFALVGVRDSKGLRQKVLLMADALQDNEEVLIDIDDNPTYPDRWCRREKNLWLKVGHHGSKTSTSKKWLEHTTPDGLFISTGPLAFGGKSATCTESNVNRRMLVEWEAVRTAQGIPAPKVTGRKQWGYGYQDDVPPNALPWPFRFHDASGRGIFSTFAGEPAPATGGEWTGVDWHLWIDRAGAGTYDLWYE
ncbi:hypothetical protein ACFP1Z_10490 [Streptomyces gamaensis]|uniref:Metallo-beta-lactamase domain-containing protein n=1 Tax=Streptomyces gamaensis TaxID=1763542 RepID=A0ABW0YZC1_9ACTN